MNELRAFVALPLPDALRTPLAGLQRELAEHLPEIRWVRPEALHLTLAFLGRVSEDSLEQLGRSMLSIGGLFSPVTATFTRLGAFPDPDRPRVLWLGVDGGDRLTELHEAVALRLRKLRMPVEQRSFMPHLTLGRCRRPLAAAGRIPAVGKKRLRGSIRFDRLVLYESRLAARGAHHLPRQIVPLQGPCPESGL